jgi:hypothetical protein
VVSEAVGRWSPFAPGVKVRCAVVTLTDEMYNDMQYEASEYRRLLMVCRERMACERERADHAERTLETLLTALRRLVEEFNPDISRRVAQPADTEAATLLYWQGCELIQQIQREAEYLPC